jgi:hypothetical protein
MTGGREAAIRWLGVLGCSECRKHERLYAVVNQVARKAAANSECLI